MVGGKNGSLFECVAVDLNTQLDFCAPDGAHPVRNFGELIPALRRVIAWTKRNCVPVVSAIDSHRPHEVLGNGTRVSCVDGSPGQRKIAFTIFRHHVRVEVDNTLSIPLDLFKHHQQLIFRERTDDLFTNPKADRLITQMPVGEFVVFGNVLEGAVKAVTLGLLSREKRVVIVSDACGYWDATAADLAIRQVHAKGAAVVTVDELLTRKLKRHNLYRLSLSRHLSRNSRRDNGRGGVGRQRVSRRCPIRPSMRRSAGRSRSSKS
ncbi:MAG: cysteine hydrolase family protein [Phycisphaerae bacterium]